MERLVVKSGARKTPLAGWVLGAAVIALVMLPAMSANATVLVKKNFDDLLKEADGIVLGTVSEVKSQYVGAKKDIVTHVTLSKLTVIHGDFSSATLTLLQDGGDVEGDVVHLEGAPTFSVDERVIVFIKGNGKQLVPFVGWTQGVYRVSKEGANERMKDHEGNFVMGVKGDEILRENVFKPEARIVAKNGKLSEEPTANAGRPDVDGPASTNVKPRGVVASSAMTVQAFIKSIKDGAKARGVKAKSLNSADARNASARPGHVKAAPPSAQ